MESINFWDKKGEIINIDLTASLIKALLYINFLSTNLISLNIYHLKLNFLVTIYYIKILFVKYFSSIYLWSITIIVFDCKNFITSSNIS